jgi:hypothetical protein
VGVVVAFYERSKIRGGREAMSMKEVDVTSWFEKWGSIFLNSFVGKGGMK